MSTRIFFYKAALTIFVACMASACSSLHPYRSSVPENLDISTDVHSVSATMDVYSTDNPCEASYQGAVDLSEKKIKAGIPANKLSRLVFNFKGVSYFTGYHSTSYSIYLTPRAGYHYEAVVSYADAMYASTIYEQDAHGGRRKIPRTEPACK